MTVFNGLGLWLLIFFLSLPHAVFAGLIRDTELEAGLETLAAPLTAAAGLNSNAIKLRIVIDPSYNAFVAGEMTVYLHSGLLLQAQSVEEILGVVAHELGHLKAGHVPRRQEALRDASTAAALATIAGLALAAGGAPTDAAMGLVIGGSDQAKRSMLRGFQRDESVADELGLQFLERAGVSANGLADMMRRMAAQRALPESHQASYYQTHPGAASRLSVYNDHLAKSSHSTATLTQETQRQAQRIIDKLRAYTESPQAVLQDPARLAAENRAYGSAIAHYRRGDLKTALALVDSAVKAKPDNAFYHEFRGDILFSMAATKAAADAYETALNYRPDSPQILLNLGRALIATNDAANLPRAIEAVELARAGEPEWAFVYRQLAIAYGRAGKIAKADLTLAEEALVLNDRQQAIRMAKRAIKHRTASPATRNRANDILFSLDNKK